MINMLQGAQFTMKITEDERTVLLVLLHIEAISAIHAVVTAHMAPESKTLSIMNQLDFITQLKCVLWNALAPNDQITVGDLPRQVLERLLEGAEEKQLTPDIVLLYRGCRRDLLMKLDSGTGFLSSLEAVPGLPAMVKTN